jgi:uroporphyrinogen-III synthase
LFITRIDATSKETRKNKKQTISLKSVYFSNGSEAQGMSSLAPARNRKITAFGDRPPFVISPTHANHAENFTSQPPTESQGDLPNRPAKAFSIAVPALSVTFYATYYYQNVVL